MVGDTSCPEAELKKAFVSTLSSLTVACGTALPEGSTISPTRPVCDDWAASSNQKTTATISSLIHFNAYLWQQSKHFYTDRDLAL